MYKKILIALFSLLAVNCYSQYAGGQVVVPRVDTVKRIRLPSTNEFTGLITYSYVQVRGESEPVTINKPLYIIYNSSFCKLSIGGVITYFDIDPSYTRELVKGDVVESFINADAETIRRGWYDIIINHKKAGSSNITINLPMIQGGCAYFIEGAKVFSENGQVNGKVHVENWKELDSLYKSNDSITRGLKVRKIDPDAYMNKGNSVYKLSITDSTKLRKVINSIIMDTHGMYIIKIDKNGYIKDVIVSYKIINPGDGQRGLKVVDRYNTIINNYFTQHKYKMPPFLHNGNPYPATIYIK